MQELRILEAEFKQKEEEEMTKLALEEKHISTQWQNRKDQLKDEMLAEVKSAAAQARLDASRRLEGEAEKKKHQYTLELRALEAKQDSLEEVILNLIGKVKAVKVDIDKLKS